MTSRTQQKQKTAHAVLTAAATELFPNLQQTELIEDSSHCPPTTDEFRGWLNGQIEQFFTCS